MCQESLINYLETELKEKCSRKDIEKFVKFAESIHETEETAINKEKKIKSGQQKTTKYESQLPDSIKSNAKEIDRLLADIKVCDPAVGSGAFPIGMMHEIVKLRRLLSLFTGGQKTNYELKRHCTENSLYGVDIDPGAVEICKLRFWLSLIVDEEDIHQIKPLPNLDYKVVCGDSLLGFPQNWGSEIEKNIENLMDRYFSETNPIEKDKLKKQIDEKIKHRFEQSERNFGYKINFDFNLFFPKVFREKGGFDVVIANPPYIDSETMTNRGLSKEREYIVRNYNLVRGNWDIYIAFFEKGLKLLRPIGTLTYITPDKWLTKPFGKELRIKKLPYLFAIVKCGRDIFETSLVDSVIAFFISQRTDSVRVSEFISGKIKHRINFPKNLLEPPSYNLDIIFSENIDLLIKIAKQPNKVENLCRCENACATSDAYKLKSLLLDLKNQDFDKRKYFKVVNTGTIGKYLSKWGYREMTYIKSKYLKPAVKKEDFFKNFNQTYIKRAQSQKLIIKGITLLQACIDLEGEVIPGKSTLVVFSDKKKNLLLICAFLNSKIAEFYLKERFSSYSYNQGVVFTRGMINNLPLPFLAKEKKEEIISLVSQILSLTQSEDYLENPQKQAQVKQYERQIDQLVYKLYDLTEEEIRIIEEEIK